MLSRLRSMGIQGIESYEVTVEVDVSRGLPSFNIVGLGDRIVNEAKERVRAAIRNSGLDFPLERITVNLLPSDVPKEGCGFDLAIATGILASTRQIPTEELPDMLIVGGLGLDGAVWEIEGALVLASGAKGGLLVLPPGNAAEALVIPYVTVITPCSLSAFVRHLRRQERLPEYKGVIPRSWGGVRIDGAYYSLEAGDGRKKSKGAETEIQAGPADFPDTGAAEDAILDMAEVIGHQMAKRALEIAAAGFHSVFVSGPPGAGKTMLSRRLPSIMPDLTYEEAIAVTKTWSVAGMHKGGLILKPPFRSPHHTITVSGMVGGGRNARPGEVSLAHGGILFCDELPLFKREVLETLRQPMEDGEVNVSRSGAKVVYPSRFMLVAAQNPCPCGRLRLDGSGECKCTPQEIRRYRMRVPSPIFDRIDIFIELHKTDWQNQDWGTEDGQREGQASDQECGKGDACEETRNAQRLSRAVAEPSASIKVRTETARNIQRERLGGQRFKADKAADGSVGMGRILANGSMTPGEVRRFISFTPEARRCLEMAAKGLGLSMRGIFRTVKVARTIADLEGDMLVRSHHMEEALSYREVNTRDLPVFWWGKVAR